MDGQRAPLAPKGESALLVSCIGQNFFKTGKERTKNKRKMVIKGHQRILERRMDDLFRQVFLVSKLNLCLSLPLKTAGNGWPTHASSS